MNQDKSLPVSLMSFQLRSIEQHLQAICEVTFIFDTLSRPSRCRSQVFPGSYETGLVMADSSAAHIQISGFFGQCDNKCMATGNQASYQFMTDPTMG